MTELDPHRLPKVARPVHYALTLVPDLDAGSFTGEAHIDLEIVEATREVWCNVLDLAIHEASITIGDTRVALTATVEADTERVRFAAPEVLPIGPARLEVRFAGALLEQLRGFYRSTFTDPSGHTRTIATTQFQATDARRAFPCWDEPEHKATFAVTLDVANELLAVSNGPIVQETPLPDGRRRVRFGTTMAMSTYLVAFVIGPLEATEPIHVDGIPIRVVHPPGSGHLTAFALESAAFALTYFREYYGIAYPAEKLDLVAVPDFAFGAMENLGCVTFRETLLLVDPDHVPQPELQRVADVIHHELAHMWFGDLVTMRWWNGIWLNEAFATFMEMKCTDAFRPEWGRWIDFGLSRSAAMDVDSLASTRPIEIAVHSPADAEGMFDLLTYEKGAAVVRMLEQYVGEDAFRDGIRSYLHRHAYGSTETHDLWDAIEQTTGVPVRKMMDTWIFQGGHPLIGIRERQDGFAEMRQSRFTYLDAAPRSWTVPVRVRADGREHRILLGAEPVHLAIPARSIDSCNVAGSGFYRVEPSGAANPRALADPIERYGLVDDAWALTLAGRMRAAEFLDLAGRFADETDVSVWQRLLAALDGISRALPTSDQNRLDARLHTLFAPARAALGATPREGESPRSTELRAILLEADALLAHDRTARDHALALHQQPDADPALAAASLRVAATEGDAARFELFLASMKNAVSPQEAERFRSALALFPQATEATRTIDLALDGTIRSQDAAFVLRSLLRNRTQGAAAWQQLVDRWDDVRRVVPTNLVARLLEGIVALAEPGLADAVDAFVEAHSVPQGRTVIDQHRERLRVHAAFRRRERGDLA